MLYVVSSLLTFCVGQKHFFKILLHCVSSCKEVHYHCAVLYILSGFVVRILFVFFNFLMMNNWLTHFMSGMCVFLSYVYNSQKIICIPIFKQVWWKVTSLYKEVVLYLPNCHISVVLDLNFGGAQFKSWPDYWLSWIWLWFLSVLIPQLV